jgi:hypothetical protein
MPQKINLFLTNNKNKNKSNMTLFRNSTLRNINTSSSNIGNLNFFFSNKNCG